MRTLIVVISFLIFVPIAFSKESHKSSYAGQESRDIKSLSPDDISELRQGKGWGLAKAAELNGVPGPVHLLELADEIPLEPGQIEQITEIWRVMKEMAIAEGEILIGLEKGLETAFRDKSINEVSLRERINAIAASRARLRFIHLSTHLKTPEILTVEQITRYNLLRGYADDPCSSTPEGHDANMWRKHNGCD